MKRRLKVVAIAVGLVGLAAFASYETTNIIWDGGFPSGEFRLRVIDPEGKPVSGASLRVYEGGTGERAYEYPLDDYLPDHELVSGEDGTIIAHRKNGEMQFGGEAWRLFWLIPMGDKAPEYDCEITADGYATLRFPVNRVFKSPYKAYDQIPTTMLEADGKLTEVPIYENVFKLTH
jgi:hypothetical protein